MTRDSSTKKAIITTLTVVSALGLSTEGIAQPTLLDTLVKAVLPHAAGGPRGGSTSPGGTAWLRETPNISGIVLGMSPADVTAAMAGKPMTLVSTDRLPARADRIKAAVDSRLGAPSPTGPKGNRATDEVAQFNFRSASGETMTASFGDGEAGRVVTAVRYHIDAARITRDRFRAQVEARYGPIPIEWDSSSYCTVGDSKCSWPGNATQLPAITVDWALNAYNMTLTEGSRTKTQRLAPIEAEIIRQAPRTANETRTTSF